MTVIAVASFKGGVGKTTTVVNLAAALLEAGKHVLVVDLDPQASLTIHLGHKQPASIPLNCSHVLKARADGLRSPTLADTIIRAPNAPDLVPSGFQLADTELVLGGDLARTFVLRDALAALRHLYDYILIDCLPGRSLLVFSALAAADSVLLPAQASYLSVQSLILALQTVIVAKRRFCPKLAILGILPTMVDSDDPDSRQMVEYVRSSLQGTLKVFETEVVRQASFGGSSVAGRSILETDPGSAGAEAYRRLALEVIAATTRPAKSDGGAQGAHDGAPSVQLAVDGANRIEQMVTSIGPSDGASAGAGEAARPTPVIQGTHASAPVHCPFLGLGNGPSAQIREPDPLARCWASGTAVLVDSRTQEATCLKEYWGCPRYINGSMVPRSKPRIGVLGRLLGGLGFERRR